MWEQQGYLSLEDMHRTEAAMGNPISIKYLADLKKGLKQFPKETHKFMGRPLKDKDFSEIDRMVMEGKIPDARGRQWNLKAPETGPEVYNAALNQKTGMSRAIARQILQQYTRLKLKP